MHQPSLFSFRTCRKPQIGAILLLLILLVIPKDLQAQTNLIFSIAATSEPDSSDAGDGSVGNERPVLIGEVVTFALSFEISEGTTNNANAVAALPDGLQYIANSQNVSFTNDAGWSDTVTVSGGGSSGADVTFDFGAITNTDSDPNAETIDITFNALVLNIDTNQSGVPLTTNVTLNANGSAAATSADRTVTVIEPDLAMTKTISLTYEASGLITTGSNDAADAGDEFTYRVQLTNNGSAPAYDIALVDFIPIDYLQQFGTAITTGGGSLCCFTYNGTTGQWNFGWGQINPGQTVAVHLRLRVRNEVAPGESWDNTADITYTSLPDADGSANNVPGAPGDDTGARNGADGIGGAVDDYARTATAPTITVPEPEVAKQIEHPTNPPVASFFGGTYSDSTDDPNTGVSEHDASNVDLAIGEEFSYLVTITFPEGSTYDFTMIDLVSPNGHTGGLQNRVLEMLSAEVIHVGANLSGGGIEPVGTFFTVEDSSPADGDGTRTQLWVDAGRDVLNTPDNAEDDDDRYVIRITARLDDEDESGGAADDVTGLSNSDGDVSGNRLQYQWRTQTSAQSTRNLFTRNDMVEPAVQVAKTTNTATSVDVGDTVQFTLTVTNTGTAPAYNLVIDDDYPVISGNEMLAFASVDTVASTCDGLAGWGVSNINPGQTQFQFDELLAGASCAIVLNATVQPEITFDETYTNTATVGGYTSTPQGVGEADNRAYTGNTAASAFTTLSPTVVKSIVGTSESHTSEATADTTANPRPVAIGEIIRYRLRANLPESTSISFKLADILVEGIEYVPGSARVSYLADTQPSFVGDFAGIQNEITPTLTFPASRINFNGASRELSFNFGSVINNDGDAGSEFIVVEVNALVTNNGANSIGNIGVNDFDVIIDEGLPSEVIETSNLVAHVVQEPGLTLSQTASPLGVNPGDTVTYTLTLTAGNSANQTAAFDALLTDALPPELTYVAGSARHVSGVAPTAITDTAAPAITFGYNTLQPGQSSTVQLQATVNNATLPDTAISNQANVVWSSLPGAQGTNSATPGAAGDADGERTGSGSGENDYVNSNTASIVSLRPNLVITKTHRGNMAVGFDSTFAIAISNQGPGYATDTITFMDTVPAELTLISAAGAGWTCGVVGQDVTCTHPGPVAPGELLPQITITVNPNTSVGSPFVNTGVVATTGELDPVDNNDDDPVTVTNASPPVLAAIPAQAVAETETLSFTFTASGGSAPLTYGLDEAPAGAAVNSASGLFSWTPTALQGPATYTATAVVTDSNQLVVSQLFTISVTAKPIDYAVAVAPGSLLEGNSGAQPVTFTISRAGLTAFASQVDYALGGTASAGSDYPTPAASGSVTFAAGRLTQTVAVSVTGDYVVEPDESLTLTLSNAVAAPGIESTISGPTATTTILNDDTAGLTVITDSLLIPELNGAGVVSLTLTSQPVAAVAINLTSSDTGICTVSPAAIQFEPLMWNEVLSFTISPVDNRDPAGNQSCVITGTVTSADAAYTVLPEVQLEVTVENDDMWPIFLPLVMNRVNPQPDLVITDLQASRDSVQVTIQNIGTASVTDDFWLDVYFNPTETPTLNRPWNTIAPAGAVWGVTTAIPAGGSLTLAVGDAWYFPQFSSGSFPGGAAVYGYVDSVNYATSTGNVAESNEANNLWPGFGSAAVPAVDDGGASTPGLPGR